MLSKCTNIYNSLTNIVSSTTRIQRLLKDLQQIKYHMTDRILNNERLINKRAVSLLKMIKNFKVT